MATTFLVDRRVEKTRYKEQGSRNKVQGTRLKEQETRARYEVQGTRYKAQGLMIKDRGTSKLLLNWRRWRNFRFWMSSPIFKFLTGLWETFISFFIRCYIIGIIAGICDGRFDLFNIGAVGQVFYCSLTFSEVDIEVLYAIDSGSRYGFILFLHSSQSTFGVLILAVCKALVWEKEAITKPATTNTVNRIFFHSA